MKYLVFILLIAVNVFSAVTTDSLKAKGSAINVKDSTNFNAGTYTTRLSTPSAGVTYLAVDSSDHRTITADSATIPVEKGAKTFRDSTYFASGIRGLRLYTPQADIDSTVGNVNHGGVNYFYGSTGYGQIKMIPGADSGECMIGFGLDRAGTSSLMWAIGQGGWSNTGDFIIGYNDGPRLTLERTGNATITGSVTAASLQLGSDDLLSVYDTGSFACTTQGFTTTITSRIKYTKIGTHVTLVIPRIEGTSNSTSLNLLCGDIPDNVLPTNDDYAFGRSVGLCLTVDNTGFGFASVEFIQSNKALYFYLNGGNYTNSGTKGIPKGGSISYMTD